MWCVLVEMYRVRDVTDELENAPPISITVDDVVTTNWRAIQSWRKTGVGLQVFNIRMIGRTVDEVKNELLTLTDSQTHAFKLNYCYAYILRHKPSDRLRYYHASHNIGNVLQQPIMIPSIRGFRDFVSELDLSESFEYSRHQRESTEYAVVCITNIVFYIYESSADLIGGCMDDIVVKGRCVLPLHRDKYGNRLRDNNCLFRAIAKALNYPDGNASVLELVGMFTHKNPTIDISKGVHLSCIREVELCFGLDIVIYTRDDNFTGRILYPGNGVGTLIHLHLEKRHYCLITDIKQYCRNYYCKKCGRMCVRAANFRKHKCVTEIKQIYPGGIFELTKTIHDRLEMEGIYVEDKFYEYRAVFDFESLICDDDLPKETGKMVFMSRHEPLSVALASNIPKCEAAVVHVSTGDPTKLVRQMLHTLGEMQAIAFDLMKKRHRSTIQLLDEKIAEALVIDPPERKCDKHPLEMLKIDFMKYLFKLPVIGFNSGKFDFNLIKKYLLRLISPDDVNVIKKGNLFMSATTPRFMFLDISLYMSPGCSYAQYLKAYQTEQRKGFFPYEFVTSISCLDYPRLPDHSAFYSTLKGTNISNDEYAWCVETWEKMGMKTLKDWLIYYNKLDVEPFIEALEKHFDFYRSLGVDMFKEAISIPGVTERYLFGSIGPEFTLLGNDDKDLHETFRSNIVGGPSILSNRHAEKDVTFIKPYKYGSESRPVRKIIGLDKNMLYPFCMQGRMPTGFAIRYLPNKDFTVFSIKKTEPKFGRSCLEWLTWMSYTMKIPIHHQYKGKEVRRGLKWVPLDGYYRDRETGQVWAFQFHGCLWHGCTCIAGESSERAKRAERTARVTEYLQSLGDHVVSIYECEWKAMRIRPDVKAVIDTLPNRKYPRQITDKKLIEMVREDQFFGFLEVDIFTPDYLKEKFFEFCPIFKNAFVSLDDLSPHMREFGEREGFMKRPSRLLISSYFGKKILLNTDLLRWYMENGLIVTKIYQAVQYEPKCCFHDFVQKCAQFRRMGDAHPDKAILANTYKLMANSSYGRCLTSRLKHCKVRYVTGNFVGAAVNDPLFSGMSKVDDDLYEVTFQKSHVVWRDCVQIGLSVYMNAKLSILSFFFDVLMKYIDDRDISYLHSDTDSIYIALAGDDLFSVIKPELRDEFLRSYHLWFPSISCDLHREEFINDPVNFKGESACCKARYNYDIRTPGLMKYEFSGTAYVALSSKTYFCEGPDPKYACKGLSKRNNLTFDTYRSVLNDKKSRGGTNKSIMYVGSDLFTYEQQRDALSYFYAKRKVLPDGVSTAPLDL